MDTGKLRIRSNFIEGYGDEPYLHIELVGNIEDSMDIWEGLFSDLLSNPNMSGKGWKGFTRDYHELKGVWNGENDCVSLNIPECIEDLNYYKGHSFSYEETADLLDNLLLFMEYAHKNGYKVTAQLVD